MKISPESLDAHLRQQLLPAYLISGEEALLTGEAADAIRARARAAGFTERDVHFMDRGGDWEAVQGAAASLSLFAERRIIEVRLPTGKPGVTGARVLTALAEAAGTDTLLLVLTGRLDRETAASAWVRALQERGAWLAVWPVSAAKLPAWLTVRARGLGLTLEPGALALLAERTEGNLLAAHQELMKLKLLCAGGRVDAAAVLASSADSARFDVGELGQVLAQGECARALRVLAGLRAEGVELPLVLWAVNRALHAAGAPGPALPAAPAAAKSGAPSGAQSAARSGAAQPRSRGPKPNLAAMTGRAVRADAMAKGQLRGDAWDEIALLAADLCAYPALSAPRFACS
ncbi:MAG TPA: DNA polymerase III subunit delta [Steroidobacteraceae bacterium]|nr:DNA polymerase III subunit delta [Steroidobacteraceae bacterium]